jgi:4a-hydroxytetrahydrobiopterin dehydratase
MTETTETASPPLRRQQISDSIGDLGWRFIVGAIHTVVRLAAPDQAADVLRLAGPAGAHLSAAALPDRVLLTLQDPALGWVTGRDLEWAREITTAVRERGLDTVPDGRQVIEFAIDAVDIPTVRSFWKAVLGYVDEPGASEPSDGLVDPARQGPAVWFQQMDAPRPQRNRIHIDISVPHDVAEQRLHSAVAAGGRVLSADHAPSFWVLVDPEGNEACVCSWSGRD